MKTTSPAGRSAYVPAEEESDHGTPRMEQLDNNVENGILLSAILGIGGPGGGGR